jgi:uncharacterized membrane protein
MSEHKKRGVLVTTDSGIFVGDGKRHLFGNLQLVRLKIIALIFFIVMVIVLVIVFVRLHTSNSSTAHDQRSASSNASQQKRQQIVIPTPDVTVGQPSGAGPTK